MYTENQHVNSILVRDFDGTQINLINKYTGKTLLIIIYNNQCLGCTGRAIPLAYQFQKDYPDIQVIGIHTNFNSSPVTGEDIKSIFTIDEIPFPIYIDPDNSVYQQFNSSGTPQWLIINKASLLTNSIFGSQEGAQNRLFYALEQLK
jgi:hypothetical protein